MDVMNVRPSMFVQRLHSPRSQLWHDLPALAQGQLPEEQEAGTEQKQQMSARASIVFSHLLPPRLAGGAPDKELLKRSVRFVRSVCS